MQLDGKELNESEVNINRPSPLKSWEGTAVFKYPQETININVPIKYIGQYDEYYNISGNVFITSAIKNSQGFIEKVKFIGTGIPNIIPK